MANTMKFRLHANTYRDNGDGTFSIDISSWRSWEDKWYRVTDRKSKPNDAPTSEDLIALYQREHRGMRDIAIAEAE